MYGFDPANSTGGHGAHLLVSVRVIAGSENRWEASSLAEENAGSIVPWVLAWNQWSVLGESVYRSPG